MVNINDSSVFPLSSSGSTQYPIPVLSATNISATNLFFAYSVNRRIVSGYTGYLLRGTLFDGSTITLNFDIGQDSNGLLDVSTIPSNATFYPTQVYDQSGTGNHFVFDRREVLINQPCFVFDSTLQKYTIVSNKCSFSIANNWANNSNITFYLDSNTAWGRGLDSTGGWGLWFFLDGLVTVISSAGYSTSFTSAIKRLTYLDFAATTQGILTATQSLTTTIPNSSLRSSTTKLLSNFTNGTFYDGYFAEAVLYTNALDLTGRQSLFNTLSA